MLALLQAIFLAVMQGVTEYLPISSSGHLFLVPWWLGWDEPPVIFFVAVHLGTLVAVLFYFRRDWLTLGRAAIIALRHRKTEDPDSHLLFWVVIGTLPAALAGLLFEGAFRAVFGEPLLAAVFLLVTALLLVLSERYGAGQPSLDSMNAIDALAVGVAQACAISPGGSRSGSTIAAGIGRGLPRSDAARYSFRLAPPIIFGAGAQELPDVLFNGETVEHHLMLPRIPGLVASGLVGYGCIRVLTRLLRQRRLTGFAVYGAGFGCGMPSLLAALFS